MASTKEALKLLRNYPRVALNNIKQRYNLPGSPTKRRKGLFPDSGQRKHNTLPSLGFEGGQYPFYSRIPKEPYYKDVSQRKEYVPLTLLQLQRMIDMGRVDTSKPIGLTSLCNSKLVQMNSDYQHYGVHLTDEGADIFDAQVCIEVQWVDELAIAALERCGSIVTSRYYDLRSIDILADPQRFFSTAQPIPVAKTPTSDVLEFYSSGKSRGYLADHEDVVKHREELAQKYGYSLPEVPQKVQDIADRRKTNMQIFYGLQPGWIVNLADKEIIKPTDPELKQFYGTETML